MKSLLFKTAWALLKSNIYSTFSEALKAAWQEIKLKTALRSRKVTLTFRKATGEITERIATLKENLITYQSKGESKFKPGQIVFWSLTNDSFRSLRIERLISFK